MNKKQILILLIIVQLISCKNIKRENPWTRVVIDGEKINCVELRQITDTISILLSDLIKDVEFIKLQTNKDYLISRGRWIVGKNYFIVYISSKGIYQFKSDGTFVRKLADKGKGPKEVDYPVMTLSENEENLYISDRRKKNRFTSINLDSGYVNENIKNTKPGQLKSIIHSEDSILVCVPTYGSNSEANKYAVYQQTISGEFLSGVKAREARPSTAFGQDPIYHVDKSLHFRTDDTIFTINGSTLRPNFIINPGNNHLATDSDLDKVTFNIIAETDKYILINMFTVTSIEMVSEGTYIYDGDRDFVYIDKLEKEAYIVSRFYNDFLGEEINPKNNFNMQNNGIFFMQIDAFSFLEKVAKLSANSKINVENKDRLMELTEELNENDNPVILKGIIK